LEESKLTLERAASVLNCSPAEIEAANQLALSTELNSILGAGPPPPSTTWFLLADMPSEKLREAFAALANKPEGMPPSSAVRGVNGDDLEERRMKEIAGLEAEVFYHLAKKAKKYNVLSLRARKALFDFGLRRTKNLNLSDRQASWADSLIRELIDKSVIRRDSPDGDQARCDLLLDICHR
jgi:hypothetical protein